MLLLSVCDALEGAVLHILQVQHQQDSASREAACLLLAPPWEGITSIQAGRHDTQVLWLLQPLHKSPWLGKEGGEEGLGRLLADRETCHASLPVREM